MSFDYDAEPDPAFDADSDLNLEGKVFFLVFEEIKKSHRSTVLGNSLVVIVDTDTPVLVSKYR
jgi:hypothetical protein